VLIPKNILFWLGWFITHVINWFIGFALVYASGVAHAYSPDWQSPVWFDEPEVALLWIIPSIGQSVLLYAVHKNLHVFWWVVIGYLLNNWG
jgi:hypothetical protein